MAYADFKRWMYRGNHPNGIASFLNSLNRVVATLGLTPNWMETLEVVGRKSGRVVSLPVAITIVDGKRYLVSMLGENVQWVLNVRAADGKAALVSGKREEVQLNEVPTDQRASIIKAYLKIAPGARPHIPVSKDAPLEEFAKIAADFPVFRVTAGKS
ncbi:MAG: nitroreductase/quinone reductase family protein [Anaerolineae bacterium]